MEKMLFIKTFWIAFVLIKSIFWQSICRKRFNKVIFLKLKNLKQLREIKKIYNYMLWWYIKLVNQCSIYDRIAFIIYKYHLKTYWKSANLIKSLSSKVFLNLSVSLLNKSLNWSKVWLLFLWAGTHKLL